MTDEVQSNEEVVETTNENEEVDSQQTDNPSGENETPEGEPEVKEPSFEERMDEMLQANPRTIVVNGKERKISSWAAWERHAAREMSAEERFQEAQKLNQEAKEIKKLIEEGDLVEILKKRGLDDAGIRKALGEVVNKIVEEDDLDPRDKKLREYEAKEAARIAAEKKAEEEAKQAKEAAVIESEAKRYVEEITESAERHGLVAEPFLLSQVATELGQAHDEGAPISVDAAVRIVKDRFVGDFSDYVRSIGTKNLNLLKDILGKEVVEALRKEEVKEAKAAKSPGLARKADSSQADDHTDVTSEDFILQKRKKKVDDGMSSQDFFTKLQRGEFDF